MKIIFFFILVIAIVNAGTKSYEGYKLYKVVPKTEGDVEILEKIKEKGFGEFWKEYFKINDDVRILVSPEMRLVFEGRLKQAGLEVKTIIEDVQPLINKQLNFLKADSTRSSSFLNYDWNTYHDLATIERFLDDVVAAYPTIVSPVVIGQSVEGRPIKGIVINYHPEANKPIGMIEGTLHAREWITPETITWMVKEFLTSTDRDVRAMAESLEWHVFPVVNPDGYVYTFTHNRMWRKNRSKANFTSCAANQVPDDMSNGVDLNRNFDFMWMSVGASSNPCLNTFAGPSAGSEPETKAISEYILNLRRKGDIVYYLSFHSFSQLFILPYSHASSVVVFPAVNHDHLVEIATKSSQKLTERYGTQYTVGTAFEVLYPMSGASFDWAMYYGNASISYLIELRDRGEQGFLLLPEQIIPNNLEIMDAMIEMDKATKLLGYYTEYSSASGTVYSLVLVALGVAFVKLFN